MTTALDQSARWSDPAFWQDLAPDLHVCDPAFIGGQSQIAYSADTLRTMQADLLEEGYTRFEPGDWNADIAALARFTDSLHGRGVLPVFSFVYDEYWLLFLSQRPFLAHMLGEDYRALPAFWAWCLPPGKDAAGFPAHRDRGHVSLFEDNRPKSLTLWIALTEATAENGCIYILPADRDKTYNTPDDDTWSFEHNDIRALPCAAGTVMCWNQALLHWGGRSSRRAQGPRISVSVEFQRGDVPAFDKPLLPNDGLPPFDLRLKLIALQILQYKHLYPLSPELEAFIMSLGMGGA
jgi:hypothetical protein